MTWKASDPVTITFGTLKMAQAEAYDLGVAAERKAILKFVNDAIDNNSNALVHFALSDLLDKIQETSKE